MNEKDKEEFEKWWEEFVKSDLGLNVKAIPDRKIEKAWQAACEYKQKEIDELLENEDTLRNHMNSIGYRELKKLQAENNSLIEALKNCPILGEIHRDSNDRFKEWNLEYKYVLKELEEK